MIIPKPSMGVPEEAITRNPETGETSFDTGLKIFPVGEGQIAPQYITWDGQLEASFKEIGFLIDQLYAISETYSQAFGLSMSGSAKSGTSFRLRLMASMKRVERLRLNIDPATKRLVWLLASIAIDPRAISILWKDGLQQDDLQQSQIEGMNVQNCITSKHLEGCARSQYCL